MYNKPIAFLKTNKFDAALSNISFPNFNPNLTEKAMFYAAKAFYALKKFI
jgi:hypothetical protein